MSGEHHAPPPCRKRVPDLALHRASVVSAFQRTRAIPSRTHVTPWQAVQPTSSATSRYLQLNSSPRWEATIAVEPHSLPLYIEDRTRLQRTLVAEPALRIQQSSACPWIHRTWTAALIRKGDAEESRQPSFASRSDGQRRTISHNLGSQAASRNHSWRGSLSDQDHRRGLTILDHLARWRGKTRQRTCASPGCRIADRHQLTRQSLAHLV